MTKNSTHLIYAVNYDSYKYIMFLLFKIKVSLKQHHVITNIVISYVLLFISNLQAIMKRSRSFCFSVHDNKIYIT